MVLVNAEEFLAAMGKDRHQTEQYLGFVRAEGAQWLPLWSKWGNMGNGPSGSTYSGLIVGDQMQKALEQAGWDVRIEGHRPGFSESHSAGKRQVSFDAIESDGVHPLVHVRLPLERFQQDLIFPEEFLLLFDLRRGDDSNWYLLDETGDDHLAIEISGDAVRVLTGLVRRYQAVKQMGLELTIDSDLWDNRLEELGERRAELRTADSCLEYYRGPVDGRKEWFSRLVGKRILTSPPVEDCGLWPFEAPRQYESYIIDLDKLGRPVEYSADPDGLANYFGKNLHAPQYVTPVTFRKDVLEKYYRSPNKYQVSDGHLRRGGFWGIRIDNEDPRFVTVMLGDLGRDLPPTEQKYWKSFNLARRGEFSETAYRRGFLGQFADAAAPDLQFRRLYGEVNEAWVRAFGWRLFLELGEDDAHLIDQVRVLPDDQQVAFDEQVLGLAKLVVDSLNEHDLLTAVGPGPEDERGIAKLERFLKAAGLPTAESVIDCLRQLQAIRSSGAAHRKGQKFEKVRAAAASTDRRLWWADLLERAIRALEELRGLADTAAERGHHE